MKKIFLLLIIPSGIFAQGFTSAPVDTTTGKINFTEVVKEDSLNQEQLYSNAKEWFAKTFNSANDVLQMDDKSSGKLIGKGLSMITIPMGITNVPEKMWFTVIIEVKNGRYRYSFTDITFESPEDQTHRKEPAENIITDKAIQEGKTKLRTKYRDEALRVFNQFIASLKKAMNKKSEGW